MEATTLLFGGEGGAGRSWGRGGGCRGGCGRVHMVARVQVLLQVQAGREEGERPQQLDERYQRVKTPGVGGLRRV